MELKTKCPLCRVGFDVFCKSKEEFMHLDMVWTNEAGQIFECQDKEALSPYVIENKDHGSGFSLTDEMKKWFKEQAEKFYADPSGFDKTNTSLNSFKALIGTFFRYSDYMDNRKLRTSVDAEKELNEMYNNGSSIKQIIDAITEPEDN